MRTFACVVAAGLLAGCAGVYDESKLPMANAVHAAGLDLCARDAKAGRFKTASEGMECQLAADASFVKAVGLTKMDLFGVYLSRMRLAAADRDAGRLADAAFTAQVETIQADFRQQVDMAYATDAASRARMAAGLSAMGASLQQAGASYQASLPVPSPSYAPPPSRPLICTTTPIRPNGTGGVTTICN